jgi:hypothetical protein
LKKKLFRIIQTLLFLALGVFFIFYFWNKLGIEEQTRIFENFKKANYWWLVASMVAGLFSHIFRALRWNLMIETFDKPPRTSVTFWALMTGYLANLAVPRLGEITRCAMLARKGKISFDKLLGSVVAERAFDLLLYVLLFFTAIAMFYDRLRDYLNEKILNGFKEKLASFSSGRMLLYVLALAAFIALLVFILRRFRNHSVIQKIRKFLSNIKNGLLSVFKIKKVFLFFLYTVVIWIFYLLMIYLVYFGIEATTGLPLGSAFVVLVFGTIGIIVVQGGIGIYPIIVSEILFLYGIDIADGYAMGWLNWGAQTSLILITGLTAFIVLSFIKNTKHESPEANTAKNPE